MIIYTAEHEFPDRSLPAFTQWFAFRHASDLYRSGFLACTCFRAIEGQMKLINIYQLPDDAVAKIYGSENFARIRADDPYVSEIMASRSDAAHTFYSPIDQAEDCNSGFLLGGDVTLLRFSVPAQSTERTEATALGFAKSLGSKVRTFRLARRQIDHPRNPSSRPPWMILIDWHDKQMPVLSSFLDLLDHLGGDRADFSHFVGERIYPWPTQRA